MSSTTPTTVSRDFREVVIEGLQKIQDAEQIYLNEPHNEKPDLATFSMVIQEDKPFFELWTQIEGCTSELLAAKYWFNIG